MFIGQVYSFRRHSIVEFQHHIAFQASIEGHQTDQSTLRERMDALREEEGSGMASKGVFSMEWRELASLKVLRAARGAKNRQKAENTPPNNPYRVAKDVKSKKRQRREPLPWNRERR